MTKSKKQTELEQQVGELTQDLQRIRADFENYRKRVDEEKTRAREAGATSIVLKVLPLVDTIERGIAHVPEELKDNSWAKGVQATGKKLEKVLQEMSIERIPATPGTAFNPEVHEAIQVDEDAEGDKEVVAEELQAGYTQRGSVVRPSMVKVTRQ